MLVNSIQGPLVKNSANNVEEALKDIDTSIDDAEMLVSEIREMIMNCKEAGTNNVCGEPCSCDSYVEPTLTQRINMANIRVNKVCQSLLTVKDVIRVHLGGIKLG